MTQIQRESMVFYDSFFEAIAELPAEEFKKCACAILGYGLRGEAPTTNGIERTIFVLVKPQIDKNNQRWQNAKKSHSGDAQRKVEKAVDKETNDKAAVKSEENKCRETDTQILTKSHTLEQKVQEDKNVVKNTDDSYYNSLFDCVPPEVSNKDFYEMKDAAPIKESRNSEQAVACGEYSNVLITGTERAMLVKELGEGGLEDAITFLSRYLRRKPAYSSNSHFEDLRGWVVRALDERKPPSKCNDKPKSNPYDAYSMEDFYEEP